MSKVRLHLKRGKLGGAGFFSKTSRGRHIVETRLAKRIGEKKVVGRLRAIQVLNKRRNPRLAAKARADARYIAGSYRGRRKVKYPGGFSRR